jgi:hypothetical protein
MVRDGETGRQAVAREAAFLGEYVRAHVKLRAEGGAQWLVDSVEVDGQERADGPELRFVMQFRAPGGTFDPDCDLSLVDDVVIHEVVTHHLAIYLRSNWSQGMAPAREPQLMGTLHTDHVALEVPRDGSFFRGLRSVVGQGIEHITSGTDHLAFLFLLLLVAPAVARHGRWSGARGTRQSLGALLRVVTAFTLGHSLTLTLGAVGAVVLPTKLVEAAIAGSVLVTAVHAARPLFPSREALMASAFGLVHGLAFASSLDGRDLGRLQTACTVVAFNAGIELAQIALVACVAPWLLLLARTSSFPRFRISGACLGGALALGWLLERFADSSFPSLVTTGLRSCPPIAGLFGLAAIACGAWLYDSRKCVRPESFSSKGAPCG